jgi:hypothetical protein
VSAATHHCTAARGGDRGYSVDFYFTLNVKTFMFADKYDY